MTPDGYRGILYLMRGTPVSGKSHLSLRLAGDSSRIFSTDEYFDKLPGGYRANWCIEKLFPAHRWNQHRTMTAMQRGLTPLVVDNTNIKMKDARVYVEYCKKYQYFPEIRESDSPWWLEISELLKDKKTNEAKLKEWASKLANGFEFEGNLISNKHVVPEKTIYSMLERYNPYTIADVEERIKMGVE